MWSAGETGGGQEKGEMSLGKENKENIGNL